VITESVMWVDRLNHWKCAVASFAMVATVAFAPSPSFGSGWFWEEVPPRIEDGSREKAMQIVANARNGRQGIFRTKAQARSVLNRWHPEIKAAARSAGINEALIVAVVIIESGGDPNAKSPAGALGLGQLMPGTALRYGVRDALDPAENLRGSATYLSDLINMFRGDLVLALAAYNTGEQAVVRYHGVPPYSETRAYVPKVLAAFETAGDFCASHPRAARRKCRLHRDMR
jgi:soluble lytic murein transglycosylase-like protein